MARYICKNKKCTSYNKEDIVPIIKLVYDKATENMIDSHIKCPICGEVRICSDEKKKDYKDLCIYYPNGLDIQLKKW
jgi:formylmethanofuran dehydrogenase subunit E